MAESVWRRSGCKEDIEDMWIKMISVILPVYNEEKNVKRIKSELVPVLKKLGKYEIVIIDDGSHDNTVNEVKKLQKKYRNIRLIKHGKNMGLGSAIRTGIKHVKGDLTITLDSDFTLHPREIPKLMIYKNDYDCVIGSHLAKGGKTKDVPFTRVVLSKVASLLYSIVLCRRISSITSILRIYKTKQLKELKLNSKGFMINAEILFKLLKKKVTIKEVPVTLTTRVHGETKINIKKEIWNNMIFLFRIMWWRVQSIL